MEAELSDRGLSDRLQIQKTGCQKQCHQAPNLVFMPMNLRQSHVQSVQVIGLLDRYFLDY
ncbi:(2Fe-2S) ferredoxin domain-containing protein [Pseudanabaena sp. FACHB-1998]|uniref:(2Fe-2S) ferredoxin domain-containing protein n=1 Tax=Pseudanabaena sp. FACHB-1998 TaxID=2692858 RepID=UPI0016815C9A|nr:(2Fe-2S) ferredoxin domain-containing protein [Pseudanabaena sp. FACHB-1998]MBD2175616.1 (2Fe-2S) ferredoxin domain-containing protein [Pseudanabaena sp. FACHB-1998]